MSSIGTPTALQDLADQRAMQHTSRDAVREHAHTFVDATAPDLLPADVRLRIACLALAQEYYAERIGAPPEVVIERARMYETYVGVTKHGDC